MKINMIRLSLLVAMAALSDTQTISAQDSVDEVKKKLQSVETRLVELQRKEQELLKEQDGLLRQQRDATGTTEAFERMVTEADWHKKHLPTIEMHAKLRSVTTSTLILPPRVHTSWFVEINGQRCLLSFGTTPQPFELRDEQDVEVLIKGKLEVHRFAGVLPRRSSELFRSEREHVFFVIHVESLKKAAD